MKRHFALEPFSRDHNDGLQLARVLMQNRSGSSEMLSEAWVGELRDHFVEEESLLGPLLPAQLNDQLKKEHREIQNLIESVDQDFFKIGVALDAHIRWEERSLFPFLETHCSEEDLHKLDEMTRAVELRRWEKSPIRERLVQRRWGIS